MYALSRHFKRPVGFNKSAVSHMLNRIKRTQSKQKYEKKNFFCLHVWPDFRQAKAKIPKAFYLNTENSAKNPNII